MFDNPPLLVVTCEYSIFKEGATHEHQQKGIVARTKIHNVCGIGWCAATACGFFAGIGGAKKHNSARRNHSIHSDARQVVFHCRNHRLGAFGGMELHFQPQIHLQGGNQRSTFHGAGICFLRALLSLSGVVYKHGAQQLGWRHWRRLGLCGCTNNLHTYQFCAGICVATLCCFPQQSGYVHGKRINGKATCKACRHCFVFATNVDKHKAKSRLKIRFPNAKMSKWQRKTQQKEQKNSPNAAPSARPTVIVAMQTVFLGNCGKTAHKNSTRQKIIDTNAIGWYNVLAG